MMSSSITISIHGTLLYIHKSSILDSFVLVCLYYYDTNYEALLGYTLLQMQPM